MVPSISTRVRILYLVTFLVVASASLQAQENAATLESQVDASVQRAVAWLSSQPGLETCDYHGHPVQELAVLALLVSGVAPADKPCVGLMETIDRLPYDDTYNVALRACVYALLLRRDSTDLGSFVRLSTAVKYFVETHDERTGLWEYGFGYGLSRGGEGYMEGTADSAQVERQVLEANSRLLRFARETRASLTRMRENDRRKTPIRFPVTVRNERYFKEGNVTRDFSNTQFAILALLSSTDAKLDLSPQLSVHLQIPPELLERSILAWTEAQRAGGGWGYLSSTPDGERSDPYSSMTLGGLFSLSALRRISEGQYESGGAPAPKKLRAALDRVSPAVDKALQWVSRNYDISTNAGAKKAWGHESDSLYVFYNLFALDRAAHVAGFTQIDGHDWYVEGARELLQRQQPDGGWPQEVCARPPEGPRAEEKGGRVISTSFALLFLRRATATLTGGGTPTGSSPAK